MNKRVVTGIVFAVAMAAIVVPSFRFPGITAGFLFIISFLCMMEYARALLRKHPQISLLITLGGSLITLAPLMAWLPYRTLREGWNLLTAKDGTIDKYWRTDFIWLVFIALGGILLFTIVYSFISFSAQVLRKGPGVIPDTILSLSGIFYISVPFALSMVFLFAVPNGFRWLILSFFLPWVVDIAAYYSGTYFGRKKFLAKISPQKTVEGFLGGILGSVLISLLFFIIFMRGPAPLQPGAGMVIMYGVISGVVIGIVSQMGDWIASAIKRYTGRKDFGRLLPGHGGLLDRFDSVLTTVPAVLIIAIFYSLF
ncbi:MAG: phosphatidate cytidylyltransferase [Fastidiosipilaceae bacterium]|jgi:phosphatidate cytidylyltransferase